jgi:hypothetical protein
MCNVNVSYYHILFYTFKYVILNILINTAFKMLVGCKL